MRPVLQVHRPGGVVSFIGRVVVFAAKTVAEPTLTKIGEAVGEAVGAVLGRKIDPTPPEDETDEEADDEPEVKS